ncbi:16S rRNA (adenine(1518)-N(6)/adenine(1519)-N(6))-dimethyltransferase RsmA [Ureaplasma ceti]|uniref:Ribosomal RNA small subunit methyltransferase A n=1 Tax=Ureaplasma ceti TaxID=3119530 RepID=A0ABP9U8G3_9BACT
MQNKQIHNFMKQESFVASKKMGQNFLSSLPIKKRIVDSAELTSNDFVVEIGPGLGAITEIILQHKGVAMLAVELDKRLHEYLTNKFHDNQNFHIINNDVLKEDLSKVINEFNTGNKAVKVVANLPYSISSKIVLKLLKTPEISTSILMVQKEMAERIAARPNTKDYNAFTALISLYLDVEYLFTVGPKNFVPAPKVDSAVIRVTKKDQTEFALTKIDEYEAFLRLAFQNKRKTLSNNLSGVYTKEQLYSVLDQLAISNTIRAEALPAETLIHIYNLLNAA